MGKWVWRFAEEESSYWKDVINLNYMLEDGGWFTKTIRENSGLGPWKNINREIVPMKLKCVFAVGDGSRIRFWRTLGVGSTP